MRKLFYFFDFISPYSYFSWVLLKRNHFFEQHNVQIEFHPIVLGKILAHWGQKAPASIAPKREYLYKDCLRFSSNENIPFQTPAQLPFNSLYALRLVAAGRQLNLPPNEIIKLIDSIWTFGWCNGFDLGDPDALEELAKKLGGPFDQLYELSFSRDVKTELKQSTKLATTKGVFGVPSFVIDDELFWGKDSMRDLKNYLAGKDAMNNDDFMLFLRKHPFTDDKTTLI